MQDQVLVDYGAYGLVGKCTLAGEVARLHVIDRLSHIPIRYEQQRIEPFLRDSDLFSIDDPLEIHLNFIVLQLWEPQHDTATLNGFDDLLRVVTTEDEPRGVAVVTDDHTKRVLCSFCQTVGLVQDDDLGVAWGKVYFLLCEFLDLLSDHVDPAFVGGVQLLYGFLGLVAQKLSHDTQDAGGFADPRRAGEDHVRDGALSDAWFEGGQLVEIAVDLAEGFRAVFLQPDFFHMAPNYYNTDPSQTLLI